MAVVPLQVGVMSGQDVLDQGDGCVVGVVSQLLGKVELGSQEVADRPQPLLQTQTDDGVWFHALHA